MNLDANDPSILEQPGDRPGLPALAWAALAVFGGIVVGGIIAAWR